jgi:RNA polymerase sigma-70 factor (ECF subfamily)
VTSDDDIIKACKRLDRKAQRMLLDRYANYLFAIALRYIDVYARAKDILQESLIKIFNNIYQYTEGTNLKTRLSRITINTSLKVIQDTKTIVGIDIEKIENYLSNLASIEDQLSYKELIKLVNRIKSPA